ncbi:hypothetical protein K0M31_004334, partial [Melipona bicolor]
ANSRHVSSNGPDKHVRPGSSIRGRRNLDSPDSDIRPILFNEPICVQLEEHATSPRGGIRGARGRQMRPGIVGPRVPQSRGRQ